MLDILLRLQSLEVKFFDEFKELKKLIEQENSKIELIARRWYYAKLRNDSTDIYLIQLCNDFDKLTKNALVSKRYFYIPQNTRFVLGSELVFSSILRPATNVEVDEAFTNEAKRRAYRPGIKVKYPWYKDETGQNANTIHDPSFIGDTYYSPSTDSFQYLNVIVYKEGVWAETLNEDDIYIGKYQVTFHAQKKSNGNTGYYTMIGDHRFNIEFWEAAKMITVNTNFKIDITEIDQCAITQKTVNQILNKLI